MIEQTLFYQIATVISGQRGNLKAGEFAIIAPNTSIKETMEIIAQGRSLNAFGHHFGGGGQLSDRQLLNENEIHRW